MKYDPVQLTIGILIGQANAFCFTGRIIGFWVCLGLAVLVAGLN